MARFCPLFSSSSGNCVYIGSGQTNILIDCGVSAKRITAALASIGLIPEAISAILVTHDHSDHICGLGNFAKSKNIPIYASAETVASLSSKDRLKDARLNIIERELTLPDMRITRFATSHDSVGSSGYRIDISEEHSFAVCTDTGIITDEIRQSISGCSLIMIESNYDAAMLRKGPYPLSMKRRIASECGHLSNGSCAEELPALIKAGASRLILGHLSRNNNLPDMAYTTATAEILKAGYTENEDYILYVAPPEGGKLFSL